MVNKQIISTIAVAVVAASIFEFLVKPQLKKVMKDA